MNLPVYEAICGENDGITAISLVADPAVESNFLVFNKDKKTQLFSIIESDNMEHKILACILRADFPIYRYSEEIGEYYIVFKRDMVEKFTQRMMNCGTYKNIDLDHNGIMVPGCELQELFIKNKDKGIDPAGFEDISEGSLFGIFKITKDEIWNEIKLGTWKGVSVEVFLSPKPSEFRKNNKYNILRKMNKFKKIMLSFLKFGSVSTSEGTLYWVGDEDLQIGDELFIDNEDGDRVKVEDGEYTTTSGIKITVEGGLVTFIEEPVIEEYRKINKLESEEVEEIVETIEETAETIEDVVEEVETTVDDVVEDPDDREELKAEIEALKAEIEALKEQIAVLMQTPAAEPVEEQYKKMNKKTELPAFGSKSKLNFNS